MSKSGRYKLLGLKVTVDKDGCSHMFHCIYVRTVYTFAPQGLEIIPTASYSIC